MSEPTFNFAGDDPEILQAYENAQATFKYFWRELYWERRRIVPGLDLAMIKLPFFDGDGQDREDGNPSVEEMWVDEVEFDGVEVSGTLINSPNWIESVSEGDQVSAPFKRLSDWMFAINGTVYGGHTVNAMRAKMDLGERRSHDAAWGLDFGDPNRIRLVHRTDDVESRGFFGRLFGRKPEGPPADPTHLEFQDHPMCVNMMEKVEEYITSNLETIDKADEDGWTTLHREALAGNLGIVKLLLRHGSDPNTPTEDGRKASDLAAAMGWAPIADVLKTAEN